MFPQQRLAPISLLWNFLSQNTLGGANSDKSKKVWVHPQGLEGNNLEG